MYLHVTHHDENPFFSVRTDSGSAFDLVKTGDGTLKVQTSGEQRFIEAHVPYYVDATLSARTNPNDPGLPIVDLRIGQIAFKYTGRIQTTPGTEQIDGVRRQLTEVMLAVLEQPGNRDLVGLLPSGDDAYRRTAVKYFTDQRVRAANALLRAEVEVNQLESRLDTARNQLVRLTATRNRAAAGAEFAETELTEVSDAARCMIVHGVIGTPDLNRWSLTAPTDGFQKLLPTLDHTGQVVCFSPTDPVVPFAALRGRYERFTGCGQEHTISEFAAGLPERAPWLLSL